jgi:predicted enzyme related to lactoylglutathione lyase
MNTVATLVQSVSDLDAATALYRALLGTEPHTTTPYYVGFAVSDSAGNGFEIGLNPAGPDGATAPIPYVGVEDIEAAVAAVTAAGATLKEAPHAVGGGTTIATVTDPDGAVLGLIHRA